MYYTKKDGFMQPILRYSGSPPILCLEIGNQAGESPIRTTCFFMEKARNQM